MDILNTMYRTIVVDDDVTSLSLVKTILEKNDFSVRTYNNPLDMIKEFARDCTDLIISDISMPEMNGLELIKIIRETDTTVPVIMLTASTDINSVVNNLGLGISDYLFKPVVPSDLVFRVQSTILDKQMVKDLKRVEREKEIIELENERLVNWKDLYATKDSKQTDLLMQFLSRSLNSGGGLVWLDFLDALPVQDDGSVIVDADLLKIIKVSAGEQRKAFNTLKLANIPKEVNSSKISCKEYARQTELYIKNEFEKFVKDAGLSISVNTFIEDELSYTTVDMEVHFKVIKELVINAIKFSSKDSSIIIEMHKDHFNKGDQIIESIIIKVRNSARKSDAQYHNSDIVGIPSELTEMVFDLFYTIESYPITHEAEEWSSGTGLYHARDYVRIMNGWLDCRNIVDYTTGSPQIQVQFSYNLPIHLTHSS